MRSGGSTDHIESPRCAWCMRPIEACNGRYGEWMHSASNTERCAGSTTLAKPETYNGMLHRLNVKRHGDALVAT